MARIDAFFRLMNAQGASDLHLASGNLPALRIRGLLERVNYQILDSEQLTELLTQKLPALRRLTITTNALATKRVVHQCEMLLDLCAAHSVGFFVGISLDGLGSVHDKMRGIPGAFDKVQQALQELGGLQRRGLRMGINCTLTNRNLHDAGELRRWSQERGLPVNWMERSRLPIQKSLISWAEWKTGLRKATNLKSKACCPMLNIKMLMG